MTTVSDNNNAEESGGTKKKNQEFRKFRFRNFRNLGIGEDAVLELNRTLKKDGLGDIVYLVGPNNSGKTNVLDGIISYGHGMTSPRDYSDMASKEHPTITFVVNDDDKHYEITQKDNPNAERISKARTYGDVDIKIINALDFIEAEAKSQHQNLSGTVVQIPNWKTTDDLECRDVRREVTNMSWEDFDEVICGAANERTYFRICASNKYKDITDKGYYGYIGVLEEVLSWGYNLNRILSCEEGDLIIDLIDGAYSTPVHGEPKTPKDFHYEKMMEMQLKDEERELKMTILKLEDMIKDLRSRGISSEKLEHAIQDIRSGRTSFEELEYAIQDLGSRSTSSKESNVILAYIPIVERFMFRIKDLRFRRERNRLSGFIEHKAEFLKKYSYELCPKIIFYQQKPVKQSDMLCNPRYPTDFISRVLKAMGVNEKIMMEIHKRSVESDDPNLRKQFEETLNAEVEETINKRFNDLYMCGKQAEYSFSFVFERREFGVELRQGDKILNLDRQSTGFKWFFDFYFNFICAGQLKHGDVILMDEPGTNLHVSGIVELRKYLKEFAKAQGLTFVISTHSPFFIDRDYLDEVRIVTKDEKTGCAAISNKFTVIGETEMDTLDPILEALTVGRHILLDPKQRVVFVEGITDYNYLVAFKILLATKYDRPEYDRLTFLPINGTKRSDLFEALLKIDGDARLLVDGDAEGKDVANRAEGTGVEVMCLDDVHIGRKTGFKTIEKLFTVEDRNKFGLYDEFNRSNKSWDHSSVFKNSILDNADEISDITKERFDDLLNRLLD
jgi:predicted ATP-dependent endonuclease of OLD family